MNERGFSLVEAVITLGVMALVFAAAMGVVTALPRQAARWDDASDARQRLRVIDARGARLAANAAPIVVRVGGAIARVPSMWPRRLGLTGSGAPADVSPRVVTFLARADGHRVLMLEESLGAQGGTVAALGGPGCGTSATCRLSAGDVLLAVSPSNAIGLYRVTAVGARLTLDALMPGAAFEPGHALVPVAMASLAFDAVAGELRLYDGYRSDNVIVDGLDAVSVRLEPGGVPRFDADERGGPFIDEEGGWRGTGELGDGPWAGFGSLSFDVDQLAVRAVDIDVALRARPDAPVESVRVRWRAR